MPTATYSSGMNARFNFALMLALEFDIYLIDEGMPSSTDVKFNKKAGDLLQEWIDRTTL
jgi:capsular polysaccharide transport system ATP-binding protein